MPLKGGGKTAFAGARWHCKPVGLRAGAQSTEAVRQPEGLPRQLEGLLPEAEHGSTGPATAVVPVEGWLRCVSVAAGRQVQAGCATTRERDCVERACRRPYQPSAVAS